MDQKITNLLLGELRRNLEACDKELLDLEVKYGLILWAAYPAGNNSLADRTLAVTSIYATADGLATGEKIDASRPLLPAKTRFVVVEGGNHAGFGWYGPQGGDGQATISRAEQQAQVEAATIEVLAALGKPTGG